MTSNVRTKMGIGAALAVGVMAAASTSYACVQYKGDMTFTNASGSQTVTGDPNPSPGMTWCGGDPVWALTAPANTTGSISITSAASTSCPDRLRDGSYNVTVHSGLMNGGALPKNINCHSGSGTRNIGTFVVSGGAGVGAGGPYNYTTAMLRIGWDNFCVWGAAVGNSDANDFNIKVV